MSLALVVTARAEADLREIWLWSYETFGEAQADRYLDDLEHGMRECAKSPGESKERNEVRRGYHSRRVGKHLIFHTFSDTEAIIQRVLHAVMDHPRHA